MKRRITLLAAAFALPAAAVIFWMLTPAPRTDTDPAPHEAAHTTASDAASPRSRTTTRASESTLRGSKIVRRSDEDFPELTPVAAPAPALPVPPIPSISPRYTLATQPDAATLARRLEGQPPLERDERIRVLPAKVTAAASTGPSGSPPVAENSTVPNRAVLLRLDATLHDPAAWLESEKPLGEKQAAVKAKIAEDFAAEVAAAAKQPETADKTFDDTWKNARAKANWEHQKFFGGEAANRAGMNAGRAAISKQ